MYRAAVSRYPRASSETLSLKHAQKGASRSGTSGPYGRIDLLAASEYDVFDKHAGGNTFLARSVDTVMRGRETVDGYTVGRQSQPDKSPH